MRLSIPLTGATAATPVAVALALTLILSAHARPASAQDAPGCYLANATPEEAAERPSPLDSASVRLNDAEVKVCYGAPSARGREVMGGLVPWDAPWRSGANEATTLRVAAAVDLGGIRLEPGSYSLYTIPGEDSWEIVVNRQFERWGIPISDEVRGDDLGSTTVPSEGIDPAVERLTFHFEPPEENRTELVLEWENTRVRIPVTLVDG